jgi:tetratricopeptide (TPR) repeat protein
MSKENVLFVIIGMLGGFIVGFFFANSVNQTATVPAAQPGMQAQGALPSGHPAVPGGAGGAVPEVQAAIDKAKQNPNDFDAQMKAAELYYQIQRFESAIEYLQKATELQPENYDALVNLANANFDAGKYEEAEKIYGRALVKKPDDFNVRTDLGLTFIFREPPNYDRAVQEFKKVLDTDPNHIQALQNLTVAYTRKADKTSASATLAKLEQLDGTNSAIPKLREELDKLGTN